MKWSLAIALALVLGFWVAGSRTASAQQMPSQCNDFVRLRDAAQQRALAIGTAEKRKADRKEICALVQRFYAAEDTVLKFLEANKTWCGVPEQAIKVSKINHEKTLKFRTVACSDAPQPHPKVPTLSDSIDTPALDTAKNTKTGHGTFDTLTGNPLAR